MQHLKPILHISVWLAFALCLYCLYISEDYARFTPRTPVCNNYLTHENVMYRRCQPANTNQGE